MEWTKCINNSIDYIESHLTDNIQLKNVSNFSNVSLFYLERGFNFITGFGIGEYIRNRRLYEAAIDLIKTKMKIIDIAFKYQYESHESFTKAFTKFHNSTPSQVRKGAKYNKFLPIKLDIKYQKGDSMDYKIVNLFPMKFIGFEKEFDNENSYQEIPKYWDEICEKYANNVYAGNPPRNGCEKTIMDYCIGEYAICIDDLGDSKFRYMIAGKYTGGEVADGLRVYELPAHLWAIFECYGPNPKTLQSINTRIYKEWLPNNPEYELDGVASIEWYDCMTDMDDPNYHSQIWIPIKKK